MSRDSRAQITDRNQRSTLIANLDTLLHAFPKEEFSNKYCAKLGARIYEIVDQYLGADLDVIRVLEAALATDMQQIRNLHRGETTLEAYLTRLEEPITRSRPEHKGKTREHLDWNELDNTVKIVAAELGVQRYKR